MSYVFASSPCFGCGRVISYNPARVPVIVVDSATHSVSGRHIEAGRHPVCESCVARVNPLRVEKGLPPIAVLSGAYEPCEEGEL